MNFQSLITHFHSHTEAPSIRIAPYFYGLRPSYTVVQNLLENYRLSTPAKFDLQPKRERKMDAESFSRTSSSTSDSTSPVVYTDNVSDGHEFSRPKRQRLDLARSRESHQKSLSGRFRNSWNLPFIEASSKGNEYAHCKLCRHGFLSLMVVTTMLNTTVNLLGIKRSTVSCNLILISQALLENPAFLIVQK